MNQALRPCHRIPTLIAVLALCACGTDTGLGPGPTGAGDAQTPPAGDAALSAWLASGVYKGWSCESGPMDARPHGAHGRNRVCSNDLMARHGSGEYPVGAAAVKELFDGGGTVIGHAVSRHVKAGNTADSWYWYEANPRVVADGLGAGICDGCHRQAGGGSFQGHDFVFVQVPPR